MKRENLTQAVEDYLKTIYELITVHGRASTTQIAEALDVKPASVDRDDPKAGGDGSTIG